MSDIIELHGVGGRWVVPLGYESLYPQLRPKIAVLHASIPE